MLATKEKMKQLTNRIFYYVASVPTQNEFPVPDCVESKEELDSFAAEVCEHLAAAHQLDDDEVSDKVGRIINDFLFSK